MLKRIVELYLVVQIIKATIENIISVGVGIIDFRNENDIGVLLFDFSRYPIPKRSIPRES